MTATGHESRCDKQCENFDSAQARTPSEKLDFISAFAFLESFVQCGASTHAISSSVPSHLYRCPPSVTSARSPPAPVDSIHPDEFRPVSVERDTFLKPRRVSLKT